MDTSYLHEAFNESEEDRYVLILRVWHPELTAEETQAITFLFDCLDDSEIITNPDGQTMYDMMKVCPDAATRRGDISSIRFCQRFSSQPPPPAHPLFPKGHSELHPILISGFLK